MSQKTDINASSLTSVSKVTKKLFSFKKMNVSVEQDKTNILSCLTSQNMLNINNKNDESQITQDSHSFKSCLDKIQETVNINSSPQVKLEARPSQISVKVDKKEHEKIWKDILKDVDVNSFFEEDF